MGCGRRGLGGSDGVAVLAEPVDFPSLLSRATPDHNGQPSTAPITAASFNCRSRLTTKYPHPLTPGNRRSNAYFRLTLTPNHFPRRAMHQGCVAGANQGEEGRGRVVADIAKLSVGREE